MRSKWTLVCALAGFLTVGVVQAEDVPEFLVEMGVTGEGDISPSPLGFGFGMDTNALLGVETDSPTFDIPGPPGPPTTLGSAAFSRAAAGTDLYRDVVPLARVVTWNLMLYNVPAGGEVELTWDTSSITSFLALGEMLTIEQTGAAASTDMTTQSQLTVTNTLGFTSNYQFEITYDATVPSVKATQNGTATTEAGGAATFTVVLGSEPAANVTVDMASSNTDEATVAPAQLTFTAADWETPQTVTVTGVDDDVDDGDQDVDVSFTVTSADTDYSSLTPAALAFVNADDADTAGITASAASPMHTTETGTPLSTFTVELDSEPTADVTIDVVSSNTDEITVDPTQLTFTAADWDVAQTVTATGVNDDVDDDDQVVNVSLTVTSNDAKYDGTALDDRILLNDDDDTAGITVTPTSGLTTDETGATAVFSVQLDSEPTADVTIPVASTDTSEGTVSTAQLTFPAGDWDTAQAVTVTGVNDDIDDGNVGYTIDLGPVASDDPNYAGISINDVLVTNTDDDVAGFSVTPTSIVTTESGGAATVSIVLQSEPVGNVVFDVTSSEATEATPDVPTVTFTPTDWDSSQTVSITGQDDDTADGNQEYDITFSLNGALTADAVYAGLSAQDVSGANVDDEIPGLIVDPLSGLVTGEDGTVDTFDVSLRTAPAADVTVTIASSNTNEGTVAPANIVFSADAHDETLLWSSPVTVTVTGVDDGDVDGDVAYQVALDVTSSDANYDGRAATVALTNLDDETAEVVDENLTFLPDATLDFGEVYVNTEKTLDVTVVNTDTENDTALKVIASAPFKTKSGSTYVSDTEVSVSVPKNSSTTVRVRFTAGATPAGDTGTLTFLNLSDQTVEVLSLTAQTIDLPEGGALVVEPQTTVAKGNTGTVEVSFDIDLETAVADVTYSYMIFEVFLPSVITTNNMDSVAVTTNSARTNGIDFSVTKKTNSVILSYLDFSGIGIAPADGGIVTITADVDVGTEAVYQVSVTSLDNFGVKGGEQSGHAFDIVPQNGFLAVSNFVVTANLDVNEDGLPNIGDLILIYRYKVDFITKDNVDQIAPASWGLSTEQKEVIAENVQALYDDGLDVNGDGLPNIGDITLIYRYKIDFITKDNVDPIAPATWGLSTEQKQGIADNVDAIMP
ncbi:MAG: hypothetical protein HOJ57_10920 [Lentisphaerae bacterium]|nr:hypothetical protein [Lentisphaerota bacterium]